MSNITTIGIDIGKNWFHLVGMNRAGKPIERHKLRRQQLEQFFATIPPCLIGMEACAGSQQLARALLKFGHEARIIPAQFVKPFLKSGKNDFNDAEAIAEAVTRPTMRFVPVKNTEQLDLQALHRMRDRFVHDRTAVINQIRAFLLENDIALRTGRAFLRNELPCLLEDAGSQLSSRMRAVLNRLWLHWQHLEQQINEVSKELQVIAKSRDDCSRLMTVPGIGPLAATAIIAAVGKGNQFRRARDLAAWLGLVPKQHSTGGTPRLLGISKRGNNYLRRLLIHGARSVYLHMNRERHTLGKWTDALQNRVHRNVVVVALANKIARISWAILARGSVYRMQQTG
jgi:transposase